MVYKFMVGLQGGMVGWQKTVPLDLFMYLFIYLFVYSLFNVDVIYLQRKHQDVVTSNKKASITG